jgi:hypothetical protein
MCIREFYLSIPGKETPRLASRRLAPTRKTGAS